MTELRGPTRSNDRDHWWRSSDYSGSAVTLDTVATPEVRYANRAGDAEVRHAAQAGWYYVVVKLSPVWTEGDATPAVQPVVEIALDVNGSPAPGPEYASVSVPTTAPGVGGGGGPDDGAPGADDSVDVGSPGGGDGVDDVPLLDSGRRGLAGGGAAVGAAAAAFRTVTVGTLSGIVPGEYCGE